MSGVSPPSPRRLPQHACARLAQYAYAASPTRRTTRSSARASQSRTPVDDAAKQEPTVNDESTANDTIKQEPTANDGVKQERTANGRPSRKRRRVQLIESEDSAESSQDEGGGSDYVAPDDDAEPETESDQGVESDNGDGSAESDHESVVEVRPSKGKRPRRASPESSPPPSSGKGKGKSKSTWKKTRGYAPPERYAHLKLLPDQLRSGLDLVFCGINPGEMTAKKGHAYSHPTNKFWRALHGSGLTPTLLKPDEDGTLPDRFNYGLTNLVRRPTAEQAELSLLEMRISVADFLGRVELHGPRAVCFVGKKIFEVFASVAKQTATPPGVRPPPRVVPSARAQQSAVVMFTLNGSGDGVIKVEPEEAASTSAVAEPDGGAKPEPGVAAGPTDARADGAATAALVDAPAPSVKAESPAPSLKSEPSVASGPSRAKGRRARPAPTRQAKPPKPPSMATFQFDRPQFLRLPLEGRPWAYTYFWTVPSTSGLERTTLQRHFEHFGGLRELVESLKTGEEPEGDFWDIDFDGVKRTVAELEATARMLEE